MLDPNELLELGRERQRTLIAWRSNHRRQNKRPPLEMVVVTISRRIMSATLSKLKSLNQVRTATPTGSNRSRREMR